MDRTDVDANVWLDRFFTEYYRQHPVNATFIGVHDGDHLLPDASEDALSGILNTARSMLTEIAWIDISDVDATTMIDLDLARGHLEIQQWELLSGHMLRRNPSWYTSEATFGVLSLFLREFAPLQERLSAAEARLLEVPNLLAQGRANVGQAHPDWVARAIRECDGAAAFLQRGIQLLTSDRSILDAAEVASRAFDQHRSHLESMQADTNLDVSAGEEAFSLLLRRGHFIASSAEDILRYAEEQALEAGARLVEGAAAFGCSDWRDVLQQLAEHRPTMDSYYGEYQRVWNAAREHAIQHDLVTWPDYPIRYVPRPDWSREAAPYLYFLFYRSPSPFDQVPVVDYLVSPLGDEMDTQEREAFLRGHNDSVIKLNHVVHHGGIGHHVQNWHAFRAESRVGRIAAVDCASRIAMFCGGTMAEGWSSYATELMGEAGFLTPLERYSQHHARLRAAVRAIADVRIHRGEWNIPQAADAYRERVWMPAGAAYDEAVKNSMFPGAAMIYLIGTDMIHDLRRDVAALDGDAFSLRMFHDEFLSYGSIPVSIIGQQMKARRADAE